MEEKKSFGEEKTVWIISNASTQPDSSPTLFISLLLDLVSYFHFSLDL